MVHTVQVTTNGFISLGSLTRKAQLEIPDNDSQSVVAPYAADINTIRRGTVRYTTFNTFSRGGTEMASVNAFIQGNSADSEGRSFSGSHMMAVEWNSVPVDFESDVSLKKSCSRHVYTQRDN